MDKPASVWLGGVQFNRVSERILYILIGLFPSPPFSGLFEDHAEFQFWFRNSW